MIGPSNNSENAYVTIYIIFIKKFLFRWLEPRIIGPSNNSENSYVPNDFKFIRNL